MVKYIHSGDQVNEKKAKNQTAGPAALQAGNVGGGTTGAAPADVAESYAIQSADNLGEAHTGTAARHGEAEAADELGVLLSREQTVPASGSVSVGATEAGATGSADHGLQAPDGAGISKQEGAPGGSTNASGQQEAPESGTAGNIAADGRGTISAAIVSAAAAAQAHRTQANDSKASVEADGGAEAGGAEAGGGTYANAGGGAADSKDNGEAAGSSNANTGEAQPQDAENSGSGVREFFSTLFSKDTELEVTSGSNAGNQDVEASTEFGTGNQSKGDSAAPGAGAGKGTNSSVDIGVDAGATGYGDHDLQASDGAGTPDQEGNDPQQVATPLVEGSSDTEASNAAGESAKGAGGQVTAAQVGGNAPTADTGNAAAGSASTPEADNAAAEAESERPEGDSAVSPGTADPGDETGSQPQDMEASDELGAEEPESGKKGFFARLFSEEPDTEEDAESDDESGMGSPAGAGTTAEAGSGQQSQAQTQQPQKSKKDKKKAKQEDAPPQGKIDPLQLKRDNERSDSLEESIIYWQGNDKVSPNLEHTKNTLTEVMGLGSSFDIVFREMSFAGRKAALLCISGFAKDTIIDEILKRLTYLTPENVSTDVLASFMTEYIPHVQVEKGELLSESINKVLSGMSVFFIEGETQVIIMDTRSYPSRNPDEPSIERVVRGSRDGFTETLLSNVALVRRRIRDPGLKYEMHQVGRRTRTDVCVAYIDDIVDKTQVKAVTDKINSVDIDGIPLADKQLEEAIVGRGWNPYPLVRYSERPDTVASHLLEGRVVIFVDTSPSVIVLPTTFFDLCQHAEENRQTPFMGTYLRWVRFIGIFASMFLLPLWMLMVIHPELLPKMLDFIGPQKTAKIPLLAQFLIVELGVDLLRMAAVHTPTPLGSAMGLIAAILVGDIAVQTGLFVNEVVLYMAIASIGMFATPSYELGLANRIVRLVLLVAVAAFQVQGFMIGTTLIVVLLTLHRSYNSSYLWPFIPFNAKAMGEIILRQPVLSSKTRPSFNKTRDNTRMPPVQENEKQS